MNFKRHRPKHQRAGCLFCKPHKDERGKRSVGRLSPAARRALASLGEQVPGDPSDRVRPEDAWALAYAMYEQYEEPFETERADMTADDAYQRYQAEHNRGPLKVRAIEVMRWA